MAETNLRGLQDQFGIDQRLKFDEGRGGLARAVVTGERGEGEVYLNGGHVTAYRRKGGRDVLFMSEKSAFAPGKAIRGGVPIVFPWFGARSGNPNAPAHGFARLREWTVESTRVVNGAVEIVLTLQTDAQTLAAWDHQFFIRYRVTMGDTLEMSLEIENREKRPMIFEEALHTYLAVSDVRNVTVHGLEATEYLDTVPPATRKRQGKQPLKLIARTDNIFLNTRATCSIEDPGNGRRIVIEKSGSESTVVWNPWVEKAREMADIGEEQWPGFICVETCNVNETGIRLEAGKKHVMLARIAEAVKQS